MRKNIFLKTFVSLNIWVSLSKDSGVSLSKDSGVNLDKKSRVSLTEDIKSYFTRQS